MALSALLGRKNGPVIGGVQVDVSLRETHSSTKTISDSPVEVGSDISDHVKKSPDEVSIDGVLSDLPSSLISLAEQEISGNTAEKRYAELLDLVSNADSFELVTGLRVYSNMVFTAFSVDRDNSSGGVIRFKATMREIEFAQSETVEVQPNEVDAGKVEPTTDRGTKPKTPAPPAAAAKSSSVLSDLTGGRQGASSVAGFLNF
jgi:hypothetical protein